VMAGLPANCYTLLYFTFTFISRKNVLKVSGVHVPSDSAIVNGSI